MDHLNCISALYKNITVCCTLACCLLMMGCRLSAYKHDERQIPPIWLACTNENAEERTLYTSIRVAQK